MSNVSSVSAMVHTVCTNNNTCDASTREYAGPLNASYILASLYTLASAHSIKFGLFSPFSMKEQIVVEVFDEFIFGSRIEI